MAHKKSPQQGDNNPQAPQMQADERFPSHAVDAEAPTPIFQVPERHRKTRSNSEAKAPRNGSAKRLRVKDPEEWERRRAASLKRREENRAMRAADKEADKADKAKAAEKAAQDAADRAAEAMERAAARALHAAHYSKPEVIREPLSAEEIAQRAAETAAQAAAREEAERNAHNTRAEELRRAIARREDLIATLDASLATSKADQQDTIDTHRQKLAEQITQFEASHAPKRGTISEDERKTHNARAETMRSAITNLEIQMPDAESTTPIDIQRRQELQKQLVKAKRGLAEQIARSIGYEKSLDLETLKPRALIGALESDLAASTESMERRIGVQRQKLAEARRELAEGISDSFRALREEQRLMREITSQAQRVEEFEKAEEPSKRAAAEGQLNRLEHELNKLKGDSRFQEEEPKKTEQAAKPAPIKMKEKESREQKLFREAAEAQAAAEEARAKHKAALEKSDPLVKRHDATATHLEQLAAAKASKHATYVAAQQPAKPKPAPKPKPKPERETVSIAVQEPKPVSKADVKSAAATSAKPEPDSESTPAKKRIRYKKIPKPLRPVPPEALLDKPTDHGAPASAMTPSAASPVDAPNSPKKVEAMPEPTLPKRSFAMMVAANRRTTESSETVAAESPSEAPPPAPSSRPNFAEAEMARRQAEEQAAANAQAEMKAAKKRQDALDEEARLETIRQQVVARLRAQREAAGASDTPTPQVLSWEQEQAAREAQRAKDDAAKDAHRARLEREGKLGKKGPARN